MFPHHKTDIYNITPEKIQLFLEGKDPQRGIVGFDYDSRSDKIATIQRIAGTVSFDDPKVYERVVEVHDFYPFCWVTEVGLHSMCGGFDVLGSPLHGKWRQRMRNAVYEYNMKCESLVYCNQDGYQPERMENGYRYKLTATTPTSYKQFRENLKSMLNIDEGNPEAKIQEEIFNKEFLYIAAVEQFMISTGKRQFKGYDDYDDLHRFVFDIETTGLFPERSHITQIGIRYKNDKSEIIHVKGDTEWERNLSEAEAIRKWALIIFKEKPDLIAGHNSETFDFNFILTRAKILGKNLINGDGVELLKDEVSLRVTDPHNQEVRCIPKKNGEAIFNFKANELTIKKNFYESPLKLGGEQEWFRQTLIPGYTVVDSLHACRRAQAIDSNMRSAGLKYAAEYAKIKKPNRVYIPGSRISTLYEDIEGQYLFNDINGEWAKITHDTLTHSKYSKDESGYYNKETGDRLTVVTGEYIADRYLMDDLYEGDKVELHYNQSTFQLAKILPIPYQKVCTMGTAATWRFLLLAWSYENGLAIPRTAPNKSFTGGLSRLFKVGYVADVVKLDFNSLYPAITLTWNIDPDLDITKVFMPLLGYILTQRETYKTLMKKSLKDGDGVSAERYNKLQLPMKIFANSFFGSFGCPAIFNWGDLSCAEQITATARQCLRLMVKWFNDRGFLPVVGDTDGINFSYTKINKNHTYTGKGLNRNVVEGKEYTGVEAYVAEFNDIFMRHKMGLGIDEYADVTLNISRKNYVDFFPDGSTKMVGNTIKSKRLPKYIEKFFDTNIKLLRLGNGQQFILNYYEYIEKIYNGEISLRDIASIGSIKKNIHQYEKDVAGVTKSGASKARQAWYELCIRDNYPANPGDKIYYVNTGKKKNDGDVKKEAIYKVDKDENILYTDRVDNDGNIVYSKRGNPPKPLKDKIVEGYKYTLNCVRLENFIIESEREYYGREPEFEEIIEYNVDKYISMFNSRVKSLLVCFSPEIRNQILVTKPADQKSFTKEQTVLVAGYPVKPTDQDTYEGVMRMEDKEINFWITNNKIPPFLEELEMEWTEIVDDYNKRQTLLREAGISDEKEKYEAILQSMTEKEQETYSNGELIDGCDLDKKFSTFLMRKDDGSLISKKYGAEIGTIYEVYDYFLFEKNDGKNIEENLD
jgi:DNA polymerase elongation subunit (family B)